MRISKDQLAQIGDLLRREYHAQRVILFGSVARGTDRPDSDMDLFVSAPTKERFYDRMVSVRRLVRPVAPGISVSPIVLTPAEVEKRLQIGDHFVREILATGVEI